MTNETTSKSDARGSLVHKRFLIRVVGVDRRTHHRRLPTREELRWVNHIKGIGATRRRLGRHGSLPLEVFARFVVTVCLQRHGTPPGFRIIHEIWNSPLWQNSLVRHGLRRVDSSWDRMVRRASYRRGGVERLRRYCTIKRHGIPRRRHRPRD